MSNLVHLFAFVVVQLFVRTLTPSRSMKYTTGVISYPDLRWAGENGGASEDIYGWRLPRSLFANVDCLPRFTLLNQSRVFGLYFKRT